MIPTCINMAHHSCSHLHYIDLCAHNVIPSSNLLFLWLLGNYDVIYDESYDETYDETYGVICEVIMRKFRASMEPFYDLKISIYVE